MLHVCIIKSRKYCESRNWPFFSCCSPSLMLTVLHIHCFEVVLSLPWLSLLPPSCHWEHYFVRSLPRTVLGAEIYVPVGSEFVLCVLMGNCVLALFSSQVRWQSKQMLGFQASWMNEVFLQALTVVSKGTVALCSWLLNHACLLECLGFFSTWYKLESCGKKEPVSLWACL